MRRFSVLQVMMLASLLLISTMSVAKEKEFPGRHLYPAVPYIEIEELRKNFHLYRLVDVRSKYEFDVLHIEGAINIPVSRTDFQDRIKALRETDTKPIVVYCNGKTCMKSYEAVSKCRQRDIPDVIAYDRGIMDWAKTYPQKAYLLGNTPVDTSRLIAKSEFKKLLIEPKQFEENIAEHDAIVVDVRDRFQRDGVGLFPGREKRVAIDDKEALRKVVALAKREKKPLYIYDEAGKQVRWLMYYLEERQAENYYFMEGGSRAYYSWIRTSFTR